MHYTIKTHKRSSVWTLWR